MKNISLKTFILVIFLKLFPYSKTKKLYDNDEFLIVFVNYPFYFEQHCKAERDNNQFLLHKYEEKIGKVFWLRKNWHCDEIEYELTECQLYRRYLDILYVYLLREYAGLPAVKPMFYVDKTFSFCKLTDTIGYLETVWNLLYSNSKYDIKRVYKLEKLPKLFNEQILFNETTIFNETELNYEEPRETFQEIVVQMGLQLKWDNEIRKINSKLLRRQKFDEFLKGMWKKNQIRQSSAKAQTTNDFLNLKQYDHMLFEININDGILNRLYGYVFVEYVRGTSYFKQICNELDKENVLLDAGLSRRDTFAECKENLAQKYDIYLGLMYLMRQNWNCAEILEESEDEQKQKEECEKYGKYLDIFYEDLFKIFAKTEMPDLSRQFPTFEPEFNHRRKLFVVLYLHNISKIFFDIERTRDNDRNGSDNKDFLELDLLNENKLRNYKANFGNLTETLRQKFDDKLKTMLKKAREEEKEMSKLNGSNKALMELRKSPFYDKVSKPENKAFIAFVKDQQNFGQFCLGNDNELMKFLKPLPKKAIFEYLSQKYEAHLGLVYLMRENWHCAKIGKKFKENDQKECQKYRKYLKTFYEYLFNLQNEDDDPLKTINSQLLIRKVELFWTLIDVVKYFSSISKEYFQLKPSGMKKLGNLLKKQKPTILKKEKLEEIFNSENGSEAITEGIHKEQFDKKIKEFCKIAGEMLQKEVKAMKKLGKRSAEFDDKFGTLFDSPFYGTIAQCCESD